MKTSEDLCKGCFDKKIHFAKLKVLNLKIDKKILGNFYIYLKVYI